MLARDVMTTAVATVSPDSAVGDVARLLLDKGISAAPVVDEEGQVVGIVSEGDLMRRPESETLSPRSWWLRLFTVSDSQALDFIKTRGQRASDVMSHPVATVDEDTPLHEVADLLDKRRIKRVPVVRGARLVGIVSRADLIRGLAVASETAEQGVVAEDESTRQAILEMIRGEDLPEPLGLKVLMRDGVAHLWGAVEDETQRRALVVAAENVQGVRGVVDHLGIVPRYVWGT